MEVLRLNKKGIKLLSKLAKEPNFSAFTFSRNEHLRCYSFLAQFLNREDNYYYFYEIVMSVYTEVNPDQFAEEAIKEIIRQSREKAPRGRTDITGLLDERMRSDAIHTINND